MITLIEGYRTITSRESFKEVMNCQQASAQYATCMQQCSNQNQPVECFDNCAKQLCANADPNCAITDGVGCGGAFGALSVGTKHTMLYIGIPLVVLLVIAIVVILFMQYKKTGKFF